MEAQKHPEYEEEKRYLEETVEHIEGKLDHSDFSPNNYGDKPSNRSIREVHFERINKLKEARHTPYFGRVDWSPQGKDDEEKFYIGKVAIIDRKVYSWAQGTLAADLYYTGSSDHEEGTLQLKRTFGIEKGNLRTITDDHVGTRTADEAAFTDELLLELLQQTRGGQLHDIVASIQARQYAIIRSPRDEILIVQGAPGSGKTQIALHRVAYLLYNHEDLRDVLILAPNRIFLGYIANVLPELGERRIPQKTFDGWIIDTLDFSSLAYEAQEASLEMLLDQERNQSERVMRYRNGQTKGSLKMASLLERYVDFLYDEVLAGSSPLECTVSFSRRLTREQSIQLTVTRTIDELREVLDYHLDIPFNLRRARVESELVDDIRQELQKRFRTETNISATVLDDSRLRDHIRDAVAPQVHTYFDGWDRENVSVAYRRLLRTPDYLYRAGAGLFSGWELELLAQDAPTRFTPFRFSDLAALLYLKILLDGTDDVGYDHIVVDEAQDITLLHLKVLHEYSRDGSITVLGDRRQGIYPYHGIQQWTDIEGIGGDGEHSIESVNVSYRSTQQIVEYANALLLRTDHTETELAEPFTRPGASPTEHSCSSNRSRAEYIAELVESELQDGSSSIAIVAKTKQGCNMLTEELEQVGLRDVHLLVDRNDQYRGGIVITPSYLTKGLEFDTVIVADANAITYPPDTLHARLLYVVLTRAAHSLHVCWIGQITPLLDKSETSIELVPALDGGLAQKPVTIEHYASVRGFDVDWCVERLAGADKLHLLKDGRIDTTVLDMVLREYDSASGTSSAETVVDTISDDIQESIRGQVHSFGATVATDVPGALALAQLTYGLLRNQMRSVGLPIPDDDPAPAEQMILLVSLLKAMKTQDLELSSGRWTTERRALEAVEEEWYDDGRRQLTLLLDYGIVERHTTGERMQIRVPQERIHDMLVLGIGHEPPDLDRDLIQQLSRLPEPIHWYAPTKEH